MISNTLRFPFSMLDNQIENLFYPSVTKPSDQSANASYPAINIGTTDQSVEVYLFVPGMKAEELDIVIEKNMLSIAGERKPLDTEDKPSKLFHQERFDGPFKRVITLPESVDTDSATAAYNDGVLHIKIAKKAVTQPQKINISVH